MLSRGQQLPADHLCYCAESRFEAVPAFSSRVIIPPGTYDFFTDPAVDPTAVPVPSLPMFPLLDKDQMTVEAAGALILMHGYDVTKIQYDPSDRSKRVAYWPAMFFLQLCDGVVFDGLEVDMVQAPITQVKVTSLDVANNRFFGTIEYGHPIPATGTQLVTMMNYDASGVPKGEGFEMQFSPLGGGAVTWGIDGGFVAPCAETEASLPQSVVIGLPTPMAGNVANLTVGDQVVLGHQKYAGNFVQAEFSSNIQLLNLTFHALPGRVADLANVRGFRSSNLKVQPSLGFFVSITADGIVAAGCEGDIEIRDCSFSGTGDDPINIHTPWLNILGFDSALETITVDFGVSNTPTGVAIIPGNMMRIVTPNLAEELATLPTTSTFHPLISPPWVVDFSQANAPAGFWANLEAASQLGDPKMANVSLTPDSVDIINCTMEKSRGRGIVLGSHDILVDGCQIRDNARPGIIVTNEVVQFMEGGLVEDITIQNCLLDGNNSGNGRFSDIRIRSRPGLGLTPDAGGLRNIWILNNTIRNSRRGGIFVNSVDTLVVLYNIFENISLEPGANPILATERHIIGFEHCFSGLIFGNSAVPGTYDLTVYDNGTSLLITVNANSW